ncbi:hypothetical protein [Streptomyces sp. NPDC058330]|uniref:hypothetical protein n=1 Tax=Streptomyces sp. NPDC058330 TaxID=3346449 RepID=UPI0036E1B657
MRPVPAVRARASSPARVRRQGAVDAKAAETHALLLGLQTLVTALLLAFAPPPTLPRTSEADATARAEPEPAVHG